MCLEISAPSAVADFPLPRSQLRLCPACLRVLFGRTAAEFEFFFFVSFSSVFFYLQRPSSGFSKNETQPRRSHRRAGPGNGTREKQSSTLHTVLLLFFLSAMATLGTIVMNYTLDLSKPNRVGWWSERKAWIRWDWPERGSQWFNRRIRARTKDDDDGDDGRPYSSDAALQECASNQRVEGRAGAPLLCRTEPIHVCLMTLVASCWKWPSPSPSSSSSSSSSSHHFGVGNSVLQG